MRGGSTPTIMAGIKNWKSGRPITPLRIGFVSTRFAGTDGVSLEAAKWAQVLEADQHECFWYAGRLDREPDHSYCVPEAFFTHPENEWINARIWGQSSRTPLVTARIHRMADYLKSTLYDFIARFDIRLLILENVLTIPMHVPLGLALAELLAETHLPSIAHHHDFYWERNRFSVNAVNDILDAAFPSRDQDLQHVAIWCPTWWTSKLRPRPPTNMRRMYAGKWGWPPRISSSCNRPGWCRARALSMPSSWCAHWGMRAASWW